VAEPDWEALDELIPELQGAIAKRSRRLAVIIAKDILKELKTDTTYYLAGLAYGEHSGLAAARAEHIVGDVKLAGTSVFTKKTVDYMLKLPSDGRKRYGLALTNSTNILFNLPEYAAHWVEYSDPTGFQSLVTLSHDGAGCSTSALHKVFKQVDRDYWRSHLIVMPHSVFCKGEMLAKVGAIHFLDFEETREATPAGNPIKALRVSKEAGHMGGGSGFQSGSQALGGSRF
jgi:hypothetical protein